MYYNSKTRMTKEKLILIGILEFYKVHSFCYKKQQSEKQVFYVVNAKYWILHQKMLISYTKNMRGYKSSTKTIN